MSKYPDDYYAYRAYLTLNHYSDVKINPEMLLGKEVAFPYKENLTNGLLEWFQLKNGNKDYYFNVETGMFIFNINSKKNEHNTSF